MGISLTACKRLLLCIGCCGFSLMAGAQTAVQIGAEIKALNRKITATPCTGGNGMLISNKAMNIFLSEKVASYLSDEGDLSLYKNYVNINAAEGSIGINHNFHQPSDSDETVRSFVVVGAKANIANAYASRYSGRYTNNQLEFNAQITWMGKPKTRFNFCNGQKQAMDAQRALIVQQLQTEMMAQADSFEHNLAQISEADVPGQSLSTVKNALSTNFYANLKTTYLQKFSEAQSAAIISSNSYQTVSDNWTTAGIYLPVIPQKFEVGNTLGSDVFNDRNNYPLAVFISHTRFWDSPKTGRFFLTFGARCSVNNSVQAGLVPEATTSGQYIGDCKTFLTPLISGKLAYLPPDSHVGVSFRVEKNFGTYHAVNGIIGIPIVLIDKKGVPAINFECQLRVADLSNSLKGYSLPGNRTFVGLTVGIPFSKIVY